MDKTGTAFPIHEWHHKQLAEFGLSKREYFAAMAMQAMATRYHEKDLNRDQVAEYSVSLADALINALARKDGAP